MPQNFDPLKTPSYVLSLLSEVCATTDYPIALGPEPGIMTDSMVRFGEPNHPIHIIAYGPQNQNTGSISWLTGQLKS